MKTFIRVLISLILGTALLQASAFEKEAKSKNIKVLISSEKPLSTGSNTLVLALSKDGKVPIVSKVSVKAFMPAMPGMPAMESKAEASYLGKGKYEVTVNLAMGGTWQLHIFITPTEGKKSRVKSSLNF